MLDSIGKSLESISSTEGPTCSPSFADFQGPLTTRMVCIDPQVRPRDSVCVHDSDIRFGPVAAIAVVTASWLLP